MCMRQLILQHLKQIRDNVKSLGQQTHSLVHFQVTPDSLVDRLQLRFCPHELGSVEDGTLQVNVDAQDEELANLHVNLATGEVDPAGTSDGGGN
jgi:hypothetical protein